MTRTLTKGCPKMLKLVQREHDEHSVRMRRKPFYQFVASPKKMALSHNKYATMQGTSLLTNKQNKSVAITNNSNSTAPTSGLFKSNGFDFSNRMSIQNQIKDGDRLPSVMEKSVKINKNNFKSYQNNKNSSVEFKQRNLKTQLDKHPLNSSNLRKQMISTEQSSAPKNGISIDNPSAIGQSLDK